MRQARPAAHRLPALRLLQGSGSDQRHGKADQERKKAELASENLVNPNDMTDSLNLTFDDSSEFDSSLSSSVTVSEGNLRISSGALGTMVSNLRTSSYTISKVHVRVVGDAIAGTTYQISLDNGTTYQTVNLEELTTITVTGTQLRIKVTLNSPSTLLDSIAVLYKA